jgi:hypothetical protein
MKLFIDCEWNSFGGELISLALVSEKGHEFYEVLGCNNPEPWIIENVMPKLYKDSINLVTFKSKLMQYLMQFESIHIIADWPEDIEWFCRCLIVGAGMRINTPPLTMEIVRIDTVSDDPHNALADARALKNYFNAIKES